MGIEKDIKDIKKVLKAITENLFIFREELDGISVNLEKLLPKKEEVKKEEPTTKKKNPISETEEPKKEEQTTKKKDPVSETEEAIEEVLTECENATSEEIQDTSSKDDYKEVCGLCLGDSEIKDNCPRCKGTGYKA